MCPSPLSFDHFSKRRALETSTLPNARRCHWAGDVTDAAEEFIHPNADVETGGFIFRLRQLPVDRPLSLADLMYVALTMRALPGVNDDMEKPPLALTYEKLLSHLNSVHG